MHERMLTLINECLRTSLDSGTQATLIAGLVIIHGTFPPKMIQTDPGSW